MISVYLREQQRYSKQQLVNKFQCSERRTIIMLKRLKEYGILKTVKYSDRQKNLTELYEDDIEISDIQVNGNEYLYVFTFVGVLIIDGKVLKCYPKYIFQKDTPLSELKQVIKVLEKYNSKNQMLSMYNDYSDKSTFNMLSVMLFLLSDYFEYGSYTNTNEIVEINGNNEILWDKTINSTFAFISDNQPYYPELLTRKRIIDDCDYFKRLHECIISRCSKELENADLLDLFDLPSADISDENLEDFGENEYILERIIKELNIQFNTHKQRLLKAIYVFVSKNDSRLDDSDTFSAFGSNSFNLVWENVCAEILNNQLETPLYLIKLPTKLTESYKTSKNKKLIELIEKPKWESGEITQYSNTTLIPDIISIFNSGNSYKFIIFDAKYYNYEITSEKLNGNPGVESVTKQYLYQLAYMDFVKLHKIETVLNCFLMPTEKEKFIDGGIVKMNILSNLGLEDIKIRLIPAKIAYFHYLNNTKLPIEDLSL